MEYKITYKTHILILLLGIIFTIIFYDFIYSAIFKFYLDTFILFPVKFNTLYEQILILIIMSLITTVHELLHGAAHKLFGGKVNYSFKVIYATTQEVTGNPLTLNQFIVVLITPVVVISLFSLLLPHWLGNLIFLINLIGSFVDIYMAFGILKYPSYSKIIDKSYGYKVV